MKKTLILFSMFFTLLFVVGCSKNYTVTFDLDGGTITNEKVEVTDGKFTVKVEENGLVEDVVGELNPTKEGYIFKGWLNGNESFDLAKTKVTSDLEVKASWKQAFVLTLPEGVTATVDGKAVSSGSSVEKGKEVVLTITPLEGKEVTEVKAGTTSLTVQSDGKYLFVMNEATTVTVDYQDIPVVKYVLTLPESITATVDGKVVSSGSSVEKGKKVVLTITPPEGKVVNVLKVNNTIVNVSENTYTFTMNLTTKVEVIYSYESKVAVVEVEDTTHLTDFEWAYNADKTTLGTLTDGVIAVTGKLEYVEKSVALEAFGEEYAVNHYLVYAISKPEGITDFTNATISSTRTHNGVSFTKTFDGSVITSEFEANDGLFMVVLAVEKNEIVTLVVDWDGEGNEYLPTTIKLDLKNVILEVKTSLKDTVNNALSYEYDDEYTYVGDYSLNEEKTVITGSYTLEEVQAGSAMNDMARYFGALYRVNNDVKSITYNDVVYTWNEKEPNTGSNWYNGETSLVSAIVAAYKANSEDFAAELILTDKFDNTYNLSVKLVVETPEVEYVTLTLPEGVTAKVNGETVSDLTKIVKGTTVTLIVTVPDGKELKTVKVGETELEAVEGVYQVVMDSDKEVTVEYYTEVASTFAKTGRYGIVPAGNGEHSGNLTIELQMTANGNPVDMRTTYMEKGTLTIGDKTRDLALNDVDSNHWANVLEVGQGTFKIYSKDNFVYIATLDVETFYNTATLEQAEAPKQYLLSDYNDSSYYVPYVLNYNNEVVIPEGNVFTMNPLDETNSKWIEKEQFELSNGVENAVYYQLATGLTGVRYYFGVKDGQLYLASMTHTQYKVKDGSLVKTGSYGIVPEGNEEHTGNLTIEFQLKDGEDVVSLADSSLAYAYTDDRELTLNQDSTFWVNVLTEGTKKYTFVTKDNKIYTTTLNVSEYYVQGTFERTETPVGQLLKDSYNDENYYLEYIIKYGDNNTLGLSKDGVKTSYQMNTTNDEKWKVSNLFGDDPYYLQLATGETGARYVFAVTNDDQFVLAKLDHVQVELVTLSLTLPEGVTAKVNGVEVTSSTTVEKGKTVVLTVTLPEGKELVSVVAGEQTLEAEVDGSYLVTLNADTTIIITVQDSQVGNE